MNHDDLTVMHACSVVDPRCDQAHQGPHFATFHRAIMLAWENSLLSVMKVDYPLSTVTAMPYWVSGNLALLSKRILSADRYLLHFVRSVDK